MLAQPSRVFILEFVKLVGGELVKLRPAFVPKHQFMASFCAHADGKNISILKRNKYVTSLLKTRNEWNLSLKLSF